MHADELAVDAGLVRRLLAAQQPQWTALPLEPVPSAGTDNALFRLGEELVVRLPRIHWAVDDVAKELRWLPRLAPHLPLAIPAPVAAGRPGEGYPWPWSVYRWLEGEHGRPDRIGDLRATARNLAGFVTALQRIAAVDGPRPGPSGRGVPLAIRDGATRAAIAELHGLVDTEAVTAVWEDAVGAPEWDGEPVWVHGDLTPGNLLVVRGRLTAVIDFGACAVGDPAVDLLPAWNLFTGDARAAYREALGVDDATWARGRGWALSVALIALPYYLETNPVITADSRFVLEQVLAADRRRERCP
jgi:aminoglycoside phosphotransferase (APT) family kinase protein